MAKKTKKSMKKVCKCGSKCCGRKPSNKSKASKVKKILKYLASKGKSKKKK